MKRPTSRGRPPRRAEDTDLDAHFFDRADAIIDLANAQLGEAVPGKVSASCLYAAARFNAWVSAMGWASGDEMAAAREETVAYFVAQYEAMLVENLDDYIANFDHYVRPAN